MASGHAVWHEKGDNCSEPKPCPFCLPCHSTEWDGHPNRSARQPLNLDAVDGNMGRRKVCVCGCSKIDELRNRCQSSLVRTIPHGTLARAGFVLLLALPRPPPSSMRSFNVRLRRGRDVAQTSKGPWPFCFVSLSLGASAVGPAVRHQVPPLTAALLLGYLPTAWHQNSRHQLALSTKPPLTPI